MAPQAQQQQPEEGVGLDPELHDIGSDLTHCISVSTSTPSSFKKVCNKKQYMWLSLCYKQKNYRYMELGIWKPEIKSLVLPFLFHVPLSKLFIFLKAQISEEEKKKRDRVRGWKVKRRECVRATKLCESSALCVFALQMFLWSLFIFTGWTVNLTSSNVSPHSNPNSHVSYIE